MGGLWGLCSGWYCRGRTGLVVVQRLGGTVMKQTRQVLSVRLSAIAFALIASQGAFADNDESGVCVGLPSQARFKKAPGGAVTVVRSVFASEISASRVVALSGLGPAPLSGRKHMS